LAGLVDPDDYKFNGIAALLGWNWPDREPSKPLSFQAGLAYRFELYWIYHGKASQDTFFVRLLNSAGQPVTHVSFPSQSTNPLSVGQMVRAETIIAIPPDLAPGLYHFQLGFSTLAVASGELTFDLPTEMTEIRIVPRN
jgi:hypothetical protein